MAYMEALNAQVEAASLEGLATIKASVHVGLFTQWVEAKTRG